MTYDNTDTNADGEIDAPVNNESVSTGTLYNDELPEIARVYLDGNETVASGRDGEIARDTDPGVVINAAIQDIPNQSDAGGRISITDYLTDVATQVVVPGDGYFDEQYRPVALVGTTVGAGLRMADGADLDPMIAWERSETSAAHGHEIRNLRLYGNYNNNAAGTAVERTDPTGHSGGLLEPLIDNCWVINWQDSGLELSSVNQPRVTRCSIAYTNNLDTLRLGSDAIASDLRVHNSGRNGVDLEGDGHNVSNLNVYNSAEFGVVIRGSNANISGKVLNSDTANAGKAQVYFGGSHSQFSGVIDGEGNTDYAVSFAGSGGNVVDATISGHAVSEVDGSYGTSVINGRSYQSATPGSGNAGDNWGGNEGLAARLGVTVVDDSSAQPYAMYKSDGAGQWSQIA